MTRDVIVIGASAGGIETLKDLMNRLPADLDASICIVLHLPQGSRSFLAEILQQNSKLICRQARSGEPLLHRHVYTAAPGRHLVFRDEFLEVATGPKENGHCPAIDKLFRSASHTFGARVIGVVLSGSLDDGTGGISSIKGRGGYTIVQDPSEAHDGAMPQSAIENGSVDEVLKIKDIAERLIELSRTHLEVKSTPVDTAHSKVSNVQMSQPKNLERLADVPESLVNPLLTGKAPTSFVCPECKGAVWELQPNVFQCHVGHDFSLESFSSAQAEDLEAALWTAIRTLRDRSRLLVRMADQAESRSHAVSAVRFRDTADELEQKSLLLEKVLNEVNAVDLDSEIS